MLDGVSNIVRVLLGARGMPFRSLQAWTLYTAAWVAKAVVPVATTVMSSAKRRGST